jgi:hypothetical protein
MRPLVSLGKLSVSLVGVKDRPSQGPLMGAPELVSQQQKSANTGLASRSKLGRASRSTADQRPVVVEVIQDGK